MSLAGKTVLVTGGTSGIGRAAAALLLAEGASVIVVGRDVSKVDGMGFATIACDLADEKAIPDLIAQLKSRGTAIHGWVLAAGTQDIRPLPMESAESLGRTMRLNVTGVLAFIGAALKARLVDRGGSIVLFSSAAVHAGGAGMVSYAASKGALEGAAKSLAMELAGQKIRVNALAPGVVITPMSAKYLSRMTEAQKTALEAAHPLGFGQPEDVAGPVAFLLSEASRWITGTVLLVDGGFCCH